MIPESFIQEVLARTDIVSLIERYVPLKKSGANMTACCPFHSEKSPSFSVSPAKQFYHCFGCGAHGTAIGFLMEYAGMTFPDALKDLAQQAGMSVPTGRGAFSSAPEETAEITAIKGLMRRATEFYRRELKRQPEAVNYLKRRGLTGEVAARFGLGWAPDAWQGLEAGLPGDYASDTVLKAGLVVANEAGRRYDRFRGRLMFPILNQRGDVIAFGGRVIGAGEPKYLNSPETPIFEKGKELYGLRQAERAVIKAKLAIVVEGYLDVIALHQYGECRAVAGLGTAFSGAQIERLLRLADVVVFCFDGDSAGRKASLRAAKEFLQVMTDKKQAWFLSLPKEHDPDTYIRKFGLDGWEKFLTERHLVLSRYLVNELVAGRDMSIAEHRSSVALEARELIGSVSASAPMFKAALQSDVETLCGLPVGLETGRRPVAGDRGGRSAAPADPGNVAKQRTCSPGFQEGLRYVYVHLALVTLLDEARIADVPAAVLDDFALNVVGWCKLNRAASRPALWGLASKITDAQIRTVVRDALESLATVLPALEDQTATWSEFDVRSAADAVMETLMRLVSAWERELGLIDILEGHVRDQQMTSAGG